MNVTDQEREAILRASIAATTAMLSTISAGIPRVIMCWREDVELIEKFILATLQARNETGCDVCGIALGEATGFVQRMDLQRETPRGRRFPDRVRDMGGHIYCQECAKTAPDSKLTHRYYDV